MTRLQLENLVAQWLNDPNKTYYSASSIQTRLNLAQRTLQTMLVDAYQDFYTICVATSTVVNQSRYKIPSDLRKIRRIELLLSGSGDTGKYQKVEPADLNNKDLLPSGAGTPTIYYLLKNYIYLKSAPSQTWTMHMDYIYRVADIAADADSPDIPEDYHEFLAILAVRADLIQDNRNVAQLLELKKDYEMRIERDTNTRKADGARMINPSADGFSRAW